MYSTCRAYACRALSHLYGLRSLDECPPKPKPLTKGKRKVVASIIYDTLEIDNPLRFKYAFVRGWFTSESMRFKQEKEIAKEIIELGRDT